MAITWVFTLDTDPSLGARIKMKSVHRLIGTGLKALALGAVVFASGAFSQAQAQIVTQAGQWDNTTFASTGALAIDFTLTPTTYSFTIDADGGVFGQGDPGPVTISGNREADGSIIVNVVDDPFFGDITGVVSNTGVLQNILFSDIPNPNIFSMSVAGQFAVNPGSIGTYVVDFDDPALRVGPPVEGGNFAQGTWSATTTSVVIPEPSSAALLALAGMGLIRRRRA